MTREKKEKLYKNIETAILLWIYKINWFRWENINYMCNDISRTYCCSPHLVKKIFYKKCLTNKKFKKILTNYTI